MFTPAELLPLCLVAAACAGALTLLVRRWLAGGRAAATVFVVLCAAFLLPLGALPLAAYVRGVVGDPSIGTLLLIGASLLPGLSPPPGKVQRLSSLLVVLAAAVLLYPLALGAGALDPYRWGLGSPWFVAAVLTLGLLAHCWRWPLLPVAVAISVLAWSAGCYESRNLWDYLLDPLLVVYALCALPRALRQAVPRFAR